MGRNHELLLGDVSAGDVLCLVDNRVTWQNGSLSFKLKACRNATEYCPPAFPLEGVDVS